MIAKLICLIITLVLFSFFMGFNLDNKCDIWFFTTTFKNVPVFMNSLISFAFGVLCTIPVAFARRIKSQKRQEEREAERREAQQKKEAKKAAKAAKAAKDFEAQGQDKASGKQGSGKTTREKILDKIQKLKKANKSSETEQEAE